MAAISAVCRRERCAVLARRSRFGYPDMAAAFHNNALLIVVMPVLMVLLYLAMRGRHEHAIRWLIGVAAVLALTFTIARNTFAPMLAPIA